MTDTERMNRLDEMEHIEPLRRQMIMQLAGMFLYRYANDPDVPKLPGRTRKEQGRNLMEEYGHELDRLMRCKLSDLEKPYNLWLDLCNRPKERRRLNPPKAFFKAITRWRKTQFDNERHRTTRLAD